MEYRLLGEMEVRSGGRAVPLGTHQQRAVLALLILRAGEIVPADRLIDELWSGAPPPTAAKTLQVYVSRLRKALPERIVTQDRGYLLRAEPDEIDIRRFEALLRQGRDEPEALDAALVLWRGPALADFRFDAFAAPEIARLEELRLEAIELWIDAKLACGAHAGLIAELETLERQHPLRERLIAQRMRALYRSGRQAEALSVFRDARARLVAELGIEPTPELHSLHVAILRHDPALAAPAAPVPAPRRRRRTPLAVAVAVALPAIAAAALATGGGAPEVEPNSLAVIDPARDALVDEVAVGTRPGDVAAGAGAVWVANAGDRSISRIAPDTATVTNTFPAGASVDALAAGASGIWTLDYGRARATRLDARFGHPVATMAVGAPPRPLAAGPSPLALDGETLWASTGASTVERVDARAGRVRLAIPVGNAPAGIAVGGGAIWVADALDDTVTRIAGSRASEPLPVGRGASGIAVGAGGVWVANTLDGTVHRLDPVTGATRAVIAVGPGPRGIAVGAGGVWVAESGAGSVSRIDPRRDRVVRTIHVGGSPEDVAVAAGRVWVSVQAGAAPPTPGTLRIVQPRDFGPSDPAVLVGYGLAAAQLSFATCAKLLNAPRGLALVPDVAASWPSVSGDGRIYRFTVRPGFRFSTGAPVTAHAFRRALERFLSPRLQPTEMVGTVGEMDAIVGVRAYRAGRAARIGGVTSTASTLTIRLTRPAPTLPHWMAMGFLCAVPPETPIRSGGVEGIPSAGPYYIAARTPDHALLLRRNPHYGGDRRSRFDAIEYRFGMTPARAVELVEAGRADYAGDVLGQVQTASAASPALDARLERRYGGKRYFVHRKMTSEYLLLNPHRPLFASARMRRAANLAVDRAALARNAVAGFSSVPADQYLPPTMPGFREAAIYPLDGPDPARARALTGGRRAAATMLVCNTGPCAAVAEIVRANLAAIGIQVTIRRLPYRVLWRRMFAPNASHDIGYFGWTPDYADPSQFIDRSIPGFELDFRGSGRYRRMLARAARLTGAARLRAYGELDYELSTGPAPAIAFAGGTARDFFSATVGCQVFHPLNGIDLTALCRK